MPPPPFTMLFTVFETFDTFEFVAYSCEPFTASVLVDDSVPGPTFVSLTVEVGDVPPSVTELCDDESYSTASASLPLMFVI